MIIDKKKIRFIFRKNKKISKYLSPNIFIYKKKVFLSCAVRFFKDKHYSEIRTYEFDILLHKIKKKIFTLKPGSFYKKEQFYSYLSPFLFIFKNTFYCLIQAKTKKFLSKIIILKSKNLYNWKQSKIKLFHQNQNLYAPAIYYNKKEKYLFYSKNNNKLYCNTYSHNFKKILKKKLIYKIKSKKSIIYAPFVFKTPKLFIMFYSFWKNSNFGEIKILTSKNLINWKNKKKSILTPDKKFQIVSEPCSIYYQKKNYLLFEVKLKNFWNIAIVEYNI